jgi:hypothetical protein
MADLFLEVIVPNEKLYEFLEDDKLLDWWYSIGQHSYHETVEGYEAHGW